MTSLKKGAKKIALSALEKVLTPLSAKWLKLVNTRSYSETVYMREGILPIPDHYYYPMINPKRDLKKNLNADRNLPGIAFNDEEQLALLKEFNYNDELLAFPVNQTAPHTYFYNNNWYETGDGEYLYNLIRHFKPNRIIEVGCGQSTLMIQNAVKKNSEDNPSNSCEHICIEPYEQPWLEALGLKIIRKRVEEIDLGFFAQLQKNDILFIDSSHMIRPQGDVLFEYLEVLPLLNAGVIVHVHDIFTPKDYPVEWVHKHLLWNEQYLLEAFLSMNSDFRLIGALNYLSKKYPGQFKAKCPLYAQFPKEPKAFWMIRND